MNSAFASVRANIVQKGPNLSHVDKVRRLYRHSLKLMGSWVVDRDIFCDEAERIRGLFESNRNCSPSASLRLIKEAEASLQTYAHPDPYCDPYMPGGSKFMRNPPLPMEICYPDTNGVPDDKAFGEAPSRTVNPDMSTCEEETGRSATGTVLVDFTTKSMS